ncbi:sigma-70 RNA polymerase sigma factor region 4 domain-containing protein [Pelosinus propionicus]|uniref:RNA polymerase sigma factor, sigma-70 family n=1 Tax=Pelosinus propionicus DSM 13327 TaxID=1123291 RepID=A0A1I4QB59_9FIRM|nr:sigma-70 family RNA polymerase sigma factor [Pelosinus propionicus]SFM36925.1 RNA polymerase sigma factor, sigma-70 family [Pelosinus propionicus DSM 13327]
MSKTIIISENNQSVMTFEEVYYSFQGLLKNKAYKWSKTYDYDEMFQVASIALWKAYEKYDSSVYSIPFMIVAAKFINYALLGYHAKHKPRFNRKTSKIKSMVSINDIVFDSKGEGVERQELIGEDETFTQEIINQMVLDKIFRKFSKYQLQQIQDVVNGYKLTEIAEEGNLSKSTIWSNMRGAFAKFRGLYVKEMAI